MKILATTITAGLILSTSILSGADDAAKPLQGVWRGARFGKGSGEDASKGVAIELTITGNHVTGKRMPEGSLGEGDIKLAADGKGIDALGTAGGFMGKTVPGIFKIEGNTLRWCVSTSGETGVRPGDFVADSSQQTWLMVLKKQ